MFAGVRKQADAKSLAEEGSDRLTPITIDVTEERSIKAAKDEVERAVGDDGLVGLVNNAGIGEAVRSSSCRPGLPSQPRGQPGRPGRRHPGIPAHDPRGQGHDRLHRLDRRPDREPVPVALRRSKFAIEAVGESLRRELTPWDIDVVVIEPGSIATEIWEKAAETADDQIGEMSPSARRLYGKQLPATARSSRRPPARHPPVKGRQGDPQGDPIGSPKHRYLVGTDAKIAARLKGMLPDRTFEACSTGSSSCPPTFRRSSGPRLEPLLDPARGGRAGEVALVDDQLRRLDQAVRRRPGQPAANADALRARLGDLGEGQPKPAEGENVDRLRDRVADGLDLLRAEQRGGVEDVGSRLLEGAQPGDGVIEIRVAAQEVLGARRQGEGKVERPGGLDRSRDPLGGALGLVELARRRGPSPRSSRPPLRPRRRG